MVVLASELITESYYLSGICSPDLEVPSASQISAGLMLLNNILGLKNSDLQLIPYYTNQFTFNSVIAQETYFITNLILLETITFNIDQTRYSMLELTRDEYFGQPRQDNITSLPFSYYCELAVGGANIYLYYVPNAVYVMKLSGKFALSQVVLDTDMALAFDIDYMEYLKHDLARFICNRNLVNLPAQTLETLQEIKNKLLLKGAPDLKLQKLTAFDKGSRLSWAQINIGQGYTKDF